MFLILLTNACSTQKKTATDDGSVKNWFNEKEYLNGLKIELHQSTDKATFAKQYNGNKDYWDKAFAYLKNTDLKALPKGRYVIVKTK